MTGLDYIVIIRKTGRRWRDGFRSAEISSAELESQITSKKPRRCQFTVMAGSSTFTMAKMSSTMLTAVIWTFDRRSSEGHFPISPSARIMSLIDFTNFNEATVLDILPFVVLTSLKRPQRGDLIENLRLPFAETRRWAYDLSVSHRSNSLRLTSYKENLF